MAVTWTVRIDFSNAIFRFNHLLTVTHPSVSNKDAALSDSAQKWHDAILCTSTVRPGARRANSFGKRANTFGKRANTFGKRANLFGKCANSFDKSAN